MFDVALFFGESHTGSVRDAIKASLNSPHRVLNVAHIEYPITEKAFFDPLFHETLKVPAGSSGLYVSMLGGNAHNILGLVRQGRPFDFILPEEPNLGEEQGSEPQTYAFVCGALRALMVYEQRFMQSARAAVGGSLIHLEAPPPVADEALIRADLDSRLTGGSESIDLAPPLLRYKLWRVQSRLAAEACASLGIEYVPVPPDALIDGHFLRPELFQDATHANGRYGDLVLQQVGERLRP